VCVVFYIALEHRAVLGTLRRLCGSSESVPEQTTTHDEQQDIAVVEIELTKQ
jgi:hypothetical protein